MVLVALLAACDCEGAQTADPSTVNARPTTTESDVLALPPVLFAPEGEATGERSHRGDIDGDGLADLLVGAVGAPPSPRAFTHVYRGVPGGISTSPLTLDGGGLGNDGGSLARCDLNGDGREDVVTGEPERSRLTVHLGGGPETVVIGGPTSQPGFARSVACAGDVNGDGVADLIVGDPFHAQHTGRAYLYAGARGPLPTTPIATLTVPALGIGSQLGLAVGGANDCDGDGQGEVLVSAPGVGAAYIFTHAQGSTMSGMALAVPNRQSWLGGAFGPPAAMGDVRLFFTAAPEAGNLYVFECTDGQIETTPIRVIGALPPHVSQGAPIAAAGDLNGDGHDDLVITGSGEFLTVVLGDAEGLSERGHNLRLPEDAERAGESVAIPGDLNGDGRDDLAVSSVGAVYIYFGSATGFVESPVKLVPSAEPQGGRPGDIGFAGWLM